MTSIYSEKPGEAVLLGWNTHFAEAYAAYLQQLGGNADKKSRKDEQCNEGKLLVPARILETHKNQWKAAAVHAAQSAHIAVSESADQPAAELKAADQPAAAPPVHTEPVTAFLSGKFQYAAEDPEDLPVTGDWVLLEPVPGEAKGIIQALLPRKSVLKRKTPGKVTAQQLLAANVDTACIVAGLDRDFNLRRIERFLTEILNCGISPVIILNKADLRRSPDEAAAEAESIAMGFPVITASAQTGLGMDELQKLLHPGKTAVFLGSSGVGKSSIINTVFGRSIRRTQEVRNLGDKGKHTTTTRELLIHPDAGILIDTPGMRELQLWSDGEDDDSSLDAFGDIAALAEGCRFSDCTHTQEPGCRVLDALETGELDASRLASYRKLKRELLFLAEKKRQKGSQNPKKRWKETSKLIKKYYKNKF